MHNTQCPEVRAIYKVVSTMDNIAKYKQYLCVVSLVIVYPFRWLTHAPVAAIWSKPSIILLHGTRPAETKNSDGTGLRGSAGLEMRESRHLVQDLRVPCVASSSLRSISRSLVRGRDGGGSERGFIHLQPRQSLCYIRQAR